MKTLGNSNILMIANNRVSDDVRKRAAVQLRELVNLCHRGR